jgi:hypothetical protein
MGGLDYRNGEDVLCYDMIPYTKDLGYTNLNYSTRTYLPCNISNLARLSKIVKAFRPSRLSHRTFRCSFGLAQTLARSVTLGASAATLLYPLTLQRRVSIKTSALGLAVPLPV